MTDEPNDRGGMDRRGFLRSAAAAGAGVASTHVATSVAAAAQAPSAAERGAAGERGAAAASRRNKTAPGDIVIERPGSDFMVDVFKTLDLEYVTANPGSSFRSLHESVVNYGGNRKPELLTCLHEESAVSIAHGYAKAAGKPMMVMAHGTVGLQHAAMGLYNAWCDRVPMFVVAGNGTDAPSAAAAPSGITPCRTPHPWCATS